MGEWQAEISLFTRWAVKERSRGLCERCQHRKAIHMHHLTYERAGSELPEDLEHICLCCHIKAHPRKAKGMLEFEAERAKGQLNVKTGFENFKIKLPQVGTLQTAYPEKRDSLIGGRKVKDRRSYSL